MKKVFLLFILLLTITGTLTGCASQKDHQTSVQNETDTSEKAELDITSQIIVMQQLQKMYGLYE